MTGRILNIPYRSQFGLDGFLGYQDSGTACAAMLLASLGNNISVAELQNVKRQQDIDFVNSDALVRLLQACQLQASAQRGYTLDELTHLIDSGRPAIARIKYDKILYRWDKSLTGEHFVVVTGIDHENDRIIVNDPAYPYGIAGYQRAYSSKVFLNAWTGFNSANQANNGLIVPHLADPIDSAKLQSDAGPRRFAAISKEMWVAEPRGLTLFDAASLKAQPLGHVMFGQSVTTLGPTTSISGTGHAWQIVETELGVIGVVLAINNQVHHLVNHAPVKPYLVEVQDTPAVRDVRGLALRQRCDISLPPLDRIAIGERLAVYSRSVGNDGEVWLAVQSPRLEFGWVREKIADTVLIRMVTPECLNLAEPSPDARTTNWRLRTAHVNEPAVMLAA